MAVIKTIEQLANGERDTAVRQMAIAILKGKKVFITAWYGSHAVPYGRKATIEDLCYWDNMDTSIFSPTFSYEVK